MTQLPVTIVGNLVSEPVMNLVNEDQVTRIRLAASRSVRSEEGEWISRDQLFINVEMWGELALNAKRSLTKGMSVVATGVLSTAEWTKKIGAEEVKFQEVRLKARHLGLDLNRFCVASTKTENTRHSIEGVAAPNPAQREDIADGSFASKAKDSPLGPSPTGGYPESPSSFIPEDTEPAFA